MTGVYTGSLSVTHLPINPKEIIINDLLLISRANRAIKTINRQPIPLVFYIQLLRITLLKTL